MDVVVVGAGPAGLVAAFRAAELGAQTVLVTRGEVGGMAANDGPIPVRVLAQAARLLREAKQLGKYGISVSEPILDYSRLLARTREVVHDVREHAARREQLENVGVTIYDNSGTARFVAAHTIETGRGLRLRTDKIILSAGGTSRRLPIPGFEFTSTHSDAWSLDRNSAVDDCCRSRSDGRAGGVHLPGLRLTSPAVSSRSRILPTEDEDVSTVVTTAFRESGMVVRENFGTIESFEKTASGVRMTFTKDGARDSAEGRPCGCGHRVGGQHSRSELPAAGVETNARGYVQVDSYLQTSAPNVFAAGDITGRLMLVPQGVHDGFVAATNAVQGATMTVGDQVSPIGSFTEPEYAQVGITEAKARETHDVVVSIVRFDETVRTIIDGRTTGFCKLIVNRATGKILGCHVVGERAVEIAQVVAIAIAGDLRVDKMARIPLSFPTYAGILVRAAYRAAQQIYPEFRGQDATVEN